MIREELHGISRGKDSKDIDWSKVAVGNLNTENVSLLSWKNIENCIVSESHSTGKIEHTN